MLLGTIPYNPQNILQVHPVVDQHRDFGNQRVANRPGHKDGTGGGWSVLPLRVLLPRPDLPRISLASSPGA